MVKKNSKLGGMTIVEQVAGTHGNEVQEQVIRPIKIERDYSKVFYVN